MINFLLFISTYIFMEFVAWFTHKYIMHGFLWVLHEDHHTKRNAHSKFELNDSFFIIFAFPSILLIILGSFYGVPYTLPIGLGIMAYGFSYFIVHEIIIHHRIKAFQKLNGTYIKGIKRAHKMHHKHLHKEDGECFGMLIVPFKYFKQELKRKQ